IHRQPVETLGTHLANGEPIPCSIAGFVIYVVECNGEKENGVPITVIPPRDALCTSTPSVNTSVGGGGGGAADGTPGHPFVAPQQFQSQSDCIGCVELVLFEKDLSGWFEAPVAAAQAAINAYLAVGTGKLAEVELDASASGAVSLCCDSEGGQGL